MKIPTSISKAFCLGFALISLSFSYAQEAVKTGLETSIESYFTTDDANAADVFVSESIFSQFKESMMALNLERIDEDYLNNLYTRTEEGASFLTDLKSKNVSIEYSTTHKKDWGDGTHFFFIIEFSVFSDNDKHNNLNVFVIEHNGNFYAINATSTK